MNRTLATVLAAATGVALLVAPSSARAELPVASAGLRPITLVVTPNYARRAERHPEIQRAINDLQRAKYAMQHASHDFGGHRVDAVAACDNAIAQLRLAMEFDR